jgi:1,2-diacylglycerol-3-alpha-glucose alpha-1,2-galactosyltransferase
MQKLRVNVVSESEVSVQGHGVHTAYLETIHALKKRDDIVVTQDMFTSLPVADVHHIHTVGVRVWSRLRDKRAKKVFSAHVVPESFRGSLVLADYWLWLAKIYLRWVYNQADEILAVSDATKDELEKIGVKKPVTVMYNSIDTSRYKRGSEKLRQEMRQKLGVKADAFIVMGAGQTQPRKRLDTFIQTAKELPEVTFLWVGGMPFGHLAAEYENVKKLMNNAPKNVLFTGIVDLDKMPTYYAISDVFMLPSIQETFGLVVVEAAASGLPIVLRNVTDYDTTFKDDAWRCDEGDFVKAITKLRQSPEAYALWQKKAKNIAKRFDSVMAADKLVRIYRDVVYNTK